MITNKLLSKPNPLLLVIVFTMVIIIALLSSFYLGRRMIAGHSPLIDATMEIKFEITTAHLWFEEIISGDKNIKIDNVWAHLKQSEWYAQVMLEGGKNPEGIFIPVDDPLLRQKIGKIVKMIRAFEEIAQKRWESRKQSGIGSDIDQRFDLNFNELIKYVDDIETALQKKVRAEMTQFYVLQGLIILLVVLLGLIIGYILQRHERRRIDFIQTLYDKEENLRTTLGSIGDAVIVTDTNSTVTRMNRVAENLTCWTFEEAKGRQLADVFHIVNAKTRKIVVNPVSKVLESGNIVGLANDTILITKDEREIPISDSGSPIRNDKGVITGVVMVFRDVTERKREEEKTKASLKEKETLLSEIHHRVKNNLNVVSSLFKLQANKIADDHVKEVFKESQNRIYAMSAIHETIYTSETLSNFSLKSYLSKLTRTIFQTYSTNSGMVNLNTDFSDTQISINQATPIGLIVNELISNSLKHAFPKGKKGEIQVCSKELGEEIELIVKDDGIGIPDELDWKNSSTLGFEIVRLLAEYQLGGSIDLENFNGTKFTVKFTLDKY